MQRARNTLRHNATMFVRNSGTAQGEAGKKIGKKKWYRIMKSPGNLRKSGTDLVPCVFLMPATDCMRGTKSFGIFVQKSSHLGPYFFCGGT